MLVSPLVRPALVSTMFEQVYLSLSLFSKLTIELLPLFWIERHLLVIHCLEAISGNDVCPLSMRRKLQKLLGQVFRPFLDELKDKFPLLSPCIESELH